jgi:hypothetical protein
MTLVLALAAFLAASPGYVGAQASRTDTGGDELPPPPAAGDPDLPVGPTKSVRGQVQRGQAVRANRSMGDGRVQRDAWVWRLRIVLRSLKAYYIRF